MKPETDTCWRREAQAEHAADRILDAAEKAFIESGVSAVGMGEIAEAAGCSRGTLYRYFGSRHELHLAYVKREAVRIVHRVNQAVANVSGPRERAIEYVLGTLREVRARPGTAAWFEPGAAGMAARMSRASEIVGTLTVAVGGPWLADADCEAALRARWLIRVIVSLLSDPEEDEAIERGLVEHFVAPMLFASRAHGAGHLEERQGSK